MDPERLVEQRVREALAPREPQPRIYAKVRWVGPARPGAAGRNGESDVVVVDPERGWLLAIEVKGGLVGRDGLGRWYAGERLTALVGGEDALPATRWDVPPSNRWSIGRYLPRLVLPSAR